MRIIFIGASGHGKVCAEIAELSGYKDILFLDDNRKLKECAGHPVAGAGADYEKFVDDATAFFVSIGNARTRRYIQEEIRKSGGKMATLIHPQSTVSRDVKIGSGSVVMAGAVINPGTVVGEGVIVNTASSVDHDCVIGDYCHIAVGSHICGSVQIGCDTWIGAGATVSNNVNICVGCLIGAGAVVVRDITESGIYKGVPVIKNKV